MLPCFWKDVMLFCWWALRLDLSVTFTYKWSTDALEVEKLPVCYNCIPADNFNPDYKSLEIKRSYGPILVAATQLQDSPFFSPSQTAETQQCCTAQHASAFSRCCTGSRIWAQQVKAVAFGWPNSKQYELLPWPLLEDSGPAGNTLQAALSLWITS